MKIAVICANGRAGRLIVQEAVNRGLDVTAVVRGENQSAAEKTITKDLFDLTAADCKDFDAVVDAFGAWTEDTIPLIPRAAAHLCDLLSGTDTRLLIVGGAGGICPHGIGTKPEAGFGCAAQLGGRIQGEKCLAHARAIR